MSWCLVDEKRWRQLPEVLALLDAHGGKLVTVYLPVDIDQPLPTRRVTDAIASLAGRDTLLWLGLTSTREKPSAPSGDERAVTLVRQVADRARPAGLGISLYHHAGFWMERVADAVRLARLAGRPGVGATLNLYHWLKVEGPEGLDDTLRASLPSLTCMTINGSRRDASRLPVEKAILPLGEGDYDVAAFVRAARSRGYRGPIGLQGYGIAGDIRGKLARSLATWRQWKEKRP